MRWNAPKFGDRRIRKGFLFFPRVANDVWRWWEHATWEEEWNRWYTDETRRDQWIGWSRRRWVDGYMRPKS